VIVRGPIIVDSDEYAGFVGGSRKIHCWPCDTHARVCQDSLVYNYNIKQSVALIDGDRESSSRDSHVQETRMFKRLACSRDSHAGKATYIFQTGSTITSDHIRPMRVELELKNDSGYPKKWVLIDNGNPWEYPLL